MQFGANRDRDGDEPTSARSPLKLRFILAIGASVFFAAIAIVGLTAADSAGWIGDYGLIGAILAAVALVDALVVWWRLRQE